MTSTNIISTNFVIHPLGNEPRLNFYKARMAICNAASNLLDGATDFHTLAYVITEAMWLAIDPTNVPGEKPSLDILPALAALPAAPTTAQIAAAAHYLKVRVALLENKAKFRQILLDTIGLENLANGDSTNIPISGLVDRFYTFSEFTEAEIRKLAAKHRVVHRAHLIIVQS